MYGDRLVWGMGIHENGNARVWVEDTSTACLNIGRTFLRCVTDGRVCRAGEDLLAVLFALGVPKLWTYPLKACWLKALHQIHSCNGCSVNKWLQAVLNIPLFFSPPCREYQQAMMCVCRMSSTDPGFSGKHNPSAVDPYQTFRQPSDEA